MKFTSQHTATTITLIASQPINPISWPETKASFVQFARLPAGTVLLQGDTAALYSEAARRGRQLQEQESMAFLLGRRLLGQS